MKRIIAVSICLAFVLSASTIPLAQEKRLTFSDFEEKVLKRIEKRNDELGRLFKKGDYGAMAKAFKHCTPYSIITTHEGEKIPAKDSAEYWEDVAEMGGTDLRFELNSFYGWELKLSEERGPHETDFAIFAITKFSFAVGSNGDVDPGGEDGSGFRHKVNCSED